MAGISNKLTNIIGIPLPSFVRNQLNLRSNKNSTEDRTDDPDNLVFLANKSGWVRMISSVNLTVEDDINYFRQLGTQLNQDNDPNTISIQEQQSLAEQFVLFGGTSIYKKEDKDYSYNLRSGLGSNGAYGMLGNQEVRDYGYKPMPGITSVKIQTQGRLGSVRSAEVSFKVWDKLQLDIIDTLYFKLGFSMFLEWGNTVFYKEENGVNVIDHAENFSIDVFDSVYSGDKDAIRTQIYKNIIKSQGNYDAMIGIVTNFSFNFSQDGGYDCNIKLMSLGILGDSMKVNKIDELPEVLQQDIKTILNTLTALKKKKAEDDKRREEERIKALNPQPEEQSTGIVVAKSFTDYYNSVTTNTPSGLKVIKTIGTTNSKGVLTYNTDATAITLGLESINSLIDVNKKYSVKVDLSKSSGLLEKIKSTVTDDYRTVFYKNDYPETREEWLQFKTKEQYDNGYKGYGQWMSANLFRPILTRFAVGTEATTTSELGKISREAYGRGSGFVSNSDNLQIDAPKEKYFLTSLTSIDIFKYDSVTFNNSGYTIRAIIGVEGYVYRNGQYEEGDRYVATNEELRQIVKSAIDAVDNPNTLYEFSTETDPTFTTEFINDRNNIKRDTYLPVTTGVEMRLKTSLSFPGKLPPKAQVGAIVTGEQDVEIKYNVWLFTNDVSVVTYAKSEEEIQKEAEAAQQAASAPAAPPPPKPITVKDVQKEEALKFQSAIEIMLRTIQLRLIADQASSGKIVYNDEGFESTDILEMNLKTEPFIKNLFNNGLFTDFFNDLIAGDKITNDLKQDNAYIKVGAKYGFNHNFMRDPENFISTIESNKDLISGLAVDYEQLMYAYLIPYKVNNTLSDTLTVPAYPVYITLGFFLMALNHMCVLYNSKDPNDKKLKPLIYIDYNNKTNFCLSTPVVLTTNPKTFFIPFEGTQDDYNKIFPESIRTGNKIDDITLFDPTSNSQNFVSSRIKTKYRFTYEGDPISGYRGQIMNVLVNIDYLLTTIASFVKDDEEHSVYLKPLLEKIVSDLNKSLGNINIFRLAFNDYSDTYYISDDQVIPPINGEESIIIGESSTTELPLYGKKSIVTSLDIKTEISTRLSNMIAISSNVKLDDKVAASKDATSVGYLNSGYEDRYKKYVTDVKVNTGSLSASTKQSAIQFNDTISGYYRNTKLEEERISHATNFFIERMNKIKAEDPPARASAMIPLSINFTTDGISGLAMGQSFTVSDDMLPYSYTTRKVPNGYNFDKKVGFILIGVDHEISNNKWTTSVRSNMFYLKNKDLYSSTIKTPIKPGVAPQIQSSNPLYNGPDIPSDGFNGGTPDDCAKTEFQKELSTYASRLGEYKDNKITKSNFGFDYSAFGTENKYQQLDVSEGKNRGFALNKKPVGIVIHHSADKPNADGTSDLKIFEVGVSNRAPSYHILVSVTGIQYQIVPWSHGANHAGTGYYKHPITGVVYSIVKNCDGNSQKYAYIGPGGTLNTRFLGISLDGAPDYGGGFPAANATQIDSAAKAILRAMDQFDMQPSANNPLSAMLITHGITTYRKYDVVPSVYNEILFRIRQLRPAWQNL